MVAIEPPIYVKPIGEDANVIVFGKSPQQIAGDLEQGAARLGGPWRKPNYAQAYFNAARILVEHGLKTNTLDDVGLPTFYLQRHATELLMKGLVSWLHDLALLRRDIGEDISCEDVKYGHQLPALFNQLSDAARMHGLPEPPAELEELVREISACEMTETWARYATYKTVSHVEHEQVVPLVRIQCCLERVISKIAYRTDGGQTYESDIHEEWQRVERGG
jgi:hypothetical protein